MWHLSHARRKLSGEVYFGDCEVVNSLTLLRQKILNRPPLVKSGAVASAAPEAICVKAAFFFPDRSLAIDGRRQTGFLGSVGALPTLGP